MSIFRLRFVAAGLACAGLAGCASFWDDVTSREFSFTGVFNPPDPMTVLLTSNDGDARANAFQRLSEPRTHGGGQMEQDEVITVLTKAANSEPQPLCRMAAIRTLGKFQDPRAVPALISSFEGADQLTPELAFMVRAQALTALGDTKQPAAATFVAEVARRPIRTDVSERERSESRDVRLAAVRSLKNFPGSDAATAAAQALASNEKDIAVRDRAKETYLALTGKEPTIALPNVPTPTIPTSTSIATVGHNQPAQ
jgi:HEAT repeat protein